MTRAREQGGSHTPKVPQWAMTRALQLRDEAVPHTPADRTAMLYAFASYIAAHEQPPVDPLDAAIGDAFDRLAPYWDRSSFVACIGATLRNHGVVVATAQPLPPSDVEN